MRTRFGATVVLLGTLGLIGFVGDGCSRRQTRQTARTWERVTGEAEDRVNLNTASRGELQRLPGINDKDADRIIENRPYASKKELLSKKVIGPRKFDEIEDLVYVRR